MYPILLFALLFMASCKAPVALEFHDNPVISHRGAWKETGLPQNSLASFKEQLNLGVMALSVMYG